MAALQRSKPSVCKKSSRLGSRVKRFPLLHGDGRGNPQQSGHQSLLFAAARPGQTCQAGLTACMRKLLVILNAMLRNQTHWQTCARYIDLNYFFPCGRGI
jgi:hypothetical protein